MSDPKPQITRFAPSPTGYLHLGHAYSAILAAKLADDGRFILRIEDIDPERCQPEFEDAIYEDLEWLGLSWDQPIRRQSEHIPDYVGALNGLGQKGLLYPCFCTRKDIAREIETAGHAPHGPDGPFYPGICRSLTDANRQSRMDNGDAFALRLNIQNAVDLAGPLTWVSRDMKGHEEEIRATPEMFGDVVLARKAFPTSYHIACTFDDHLQGVSLVSRGEDLSASTHIHRLLQSLLNLSSPSYLHHPLLTNEKGKRYAKRDKSLTLRSLRGAGKTPRDIRALVGL